MIVTGRSNTDKDMHCLYCLGLNGLYVVWKKKRGKNKRGHFTEKLIMVLSCTRQISVFWNSVTLIFFVQIEASACEASCICYLHKLYSKQPPLCQQHFSSGWRLHALYSQRTCATQNAEAIWLLALSEIWCTCFTSFVYSRNALFHSMQFLMLLHVVDFYLSLKVFLQVRWGAGGGGVSWPFR